MMNRLVIAMYSEQAVSWQAVIFSIILCCISVDCFAMQDSFLEAKNSISYVDTITGWHWYNESSEKEDKGELNELLNAFNQLSSIEQLKILKMATDNLKAKAVLSGKVADITAYKEAQDFWVQRASIFTVGWEKMLLLRPDLNYALQYSNENALAPVMQDKKHAAEKEAILQLAKKSGILFFYRGKEQSDQSFSKIIQRYASRYHMALVPISVDGVTSDVFSSAVITDGLRQAHELNVTYFPAIVLVNPKTKQHEVVSYGFKSEGELSARLLKISNGWQAGF